MVRPADSSLRPDFDAFLFAAIGKNSHGLQVSVVSGLAQSELDPWAEASKLAQLPRKTAIERLTLLIGKLPDRGWAYPDAVTAATRLIALLPNQHLGWCETPVQTLGVTNSKSWWIYIAFMSFFLSFQFFIASYQPRVDNTAVKASSEVATAPKASGIGSDAAQTHSD